MRINSKIAVIIKLSLLCVMVCLLIEGCKKTALSASKKSLITDTVAVFGTEAQILKIICLQSGKALEIENKDTINGAVAIQNPYLGDSIAFSNQQWKILDQGTGYYKIMNLGSSKYLDNQGQVGSGIVLSQWTGNATDGQLWQIFKADSISYEIINKLSGLAVTNSGNSTANGNVITQQTYVDSLAQHWVLRNIPAGI